MKKELKRIVTATHLCTVYKMVEQFAEQNIEAEAGMQLIFVTLDEMLDLTYGFWHFVFDHQCWRLHKDLERIWNRLHGIHATTSQRRAFQQAEYVLYGACLAYGLTEREIGKPHDIIHRIELLGKTVVERCNGDEKDYKLAEDLKKTISITPEEKAGFALEDLSK